MAARWKPSRIGAEAWETLDRAGDQHWLRGRAGNLAREALQKTVLFPATRFVARPTVRGAERSALHAPAGDHRGEPLLRPRHAAHPRRAAALLALADARRRGGGPLLPPRARSRSITELWIGTFAFDRGAEGRGLAQAATLLRDGTNVLLYPQGTRSVGLGGFRAGVARLAVACDVPVVPVHVGGTALLMPKDRGLTQRGRCTVTFGGPLHPDRAEEPRDFAARLSAAIASLAVT